MFGLISDYYFAWHLPVNERDKVGVGDTGRKEVEREGRKDCKQSFNEQGTELPRVRMV